MTQIEMLQEFFNKASSLDQSIIDDLEIRNKIDYVCRSTNRAGARLLMACSLAKSLYPNIDPRKPYTDIGGEDCFSGRTIDEQHLTGFIHAHDLPLNHSTAFQTPAFRVNRSLTTDQKLTGRPPALYIYVLELLEHLALKRIESDVLFTEILRILLQMRKENSELLAPLLERQKHMDGMLPLSSEAIVTLISQHLECPKSSRLPVLIVAAAYEVASKQLSERILPLNDHYAADSQTHSLGDIEVCLIDDDMVITAYEMKQKIITNNDIDTAVDKINRAANKIHNYLFVTTERIDPTVAEYAASFYERTEGTEIAILDCISFLRHFLHLFHRIRTDYLNTYQNLVLNEPHSAVRQELKLAFLGLRSASESNRES